MDRRLIRLPDNSIKTLSDLSEEDIEDLNVIANISLMNLADTHPNLLVFPQSFNEYGDSLASQRICSFYDNKISTGNLMGFVGYNSIELAIHSRFAETDGNDYFLHYLLQKVLCGYVIDWKHSYSETTILDFLIFLFPYFFNKALSQGLFREYQRKHYNDSKVNGPIDVSRHIQSNIPFNGKIAYNTREYSYDNRITQLIRHTIEHIKRLPIGQNLLLEQETQNNIRLITDNTPTYSHQGLRKVMSDNLKEVQHPYYTEYTPLQKICLSILKYEGLKYESETSNQVYGVLFDGAWLWEEYVAMLLQNGFNHYTLDNSNFKLLQGASGNRKQKIVPDYISKDNKFEEKIVGDAKYIPLNKNADYDEERAKDIYYKTIMYMLRFSSKHGFLFFPSKEHTEPKKYIIIDTDNHLTEYPFIVPTEDVKTFNEYCTQISNEEERFKSNISV